MSHYAPYMGNHVDLPDWQNYHSKTVCKVMSQKHSQILVYVYICIQIYFMT